MKNPFKQDAISDRILFPLGWTVDKESAINWSHVNNIILPSDLIEVWDTVGGGDFFETETLFIPDCGKLKSLEIEYIDTVSAFHHTCGLDPQYRIIHKGIFISTVKNGESGIYTHSATNYEIEKKYHSFAEWYFTGIRPVFSKVYGLSTVVLPSFPPSALTPKTL